MQRKGARRQGALGTDVESALDELYSMPPHRFVSRREELALAARAAGRAEDARTIHAARRPSTAAWAANQLLRSQPEESRRFLELGQALREAYSTLDSAAAKELSAQRRRVVSALSRQAAQLAQEAGQPLSPAVQREVESTLLAVLADPEAADRWAGGRLETTLTPPADFASGAASSAAAPPKPSRTTAARSPAQAQEQAQTRTKDELAERRRRRQQQLTEARKAAKAAERRLRDMRTRQADADEALQQAQDRQNRARQEVAAAEERLHQAREQLHDADGEQRRAEERRHEAAAALARTEREAHEAAEELSRVTTSSP